jgi:hypothetical protein
MIDLEAVPTPRQRRWLITGCHLGLASALTALQWFLFSINCVYGIFGVPVLAVWCIFAHLLAVPTHLHRWVAVTTAAVTGYIPMLATCAGVRLSSG